MVIPTEGYRLDAAPMELNRKQQTICYKYAAPLALNLMVEMHLREFEKKSHRDGLGIEKTEYKF